MQDAAFLLEYKIRRKEWGPIKRKLRAFKSLSRREKCELRTAIHIRIHISSVV
eukprot:COSAG05_NODE_129_length_17200_cov_47.810128_4_plen_53_part_00